eukprot:Plantae.Rhodophyta-Purpureofilum_apyrenoidigerum.ctg82836.p3 GENE.Plantae.Rhodophyta-Purpureofilum_apyrenoidigerum.ctg82836~~Plantae.Rhodophyta-Purpureofilum_apyrenoidigerum.ctg82836.p3  ORF type:complete len:129 (-),score=22.29 Plantae.Rhodophyta-Purpureofilum_apyrenoidigerum.ctg82836:26-412(-)
MHHVLKELAELMQGANCVVGARELRVSELVPMCDIIDDLNSPAPRPSAAFHIVAVISSHDHVSGVDLPPLADLEEGCRAWLGGLERAVESLVKPLAGELSEVLQGVVRVASQQRPSHLDAIEKIEELV